jgi:hypothetical protein
MDPVYLDYKIIVDVYCQYTMILNRVLIEGSYEAHALNILQLPNHVLIEGMYKTHTLNIIRYQIVCLSKDCMRHTHSIPADK